MASEERADVFSVRIFGKEELPLDIALLIDLKQSRFQTQQKISGFVDSEGRIDSQTGKWDWLASGRAQFRELISQVAFQFVGPVSFAHAIVRCLGRVLEEGPQ